MTVTFTVSIDVPSTHDDADYLDDLSPACAVIGQFAARLFQANGIPGATALDTTAEIGDSRL